MFAANLDGAESTERHPGHIDTENLDEWRSILLQGKIEALNVGGEILDVDTTDFNKIDYNEIFNVIKTKTNIS